MREGFGASATAPPYNLASAAKALLDTLYIATRRGRRFASLPELDVAGLDEAELRRLLHRQVLAAPIRHAMEGRLAALLAVGER